ncbi:hypothetical protein [Streptomyces kronopolitis]|uniref:hypothetical protein n=1 Tax=Streptomyces kronopolitis TaxID=1612435 RepID=UPI0020C03B0E|nr:hypothetical protein [Streptomyces kronopolitis]MCL6299486.1 hypothetical protein [Streptomyces kronopolitis]
MTLDGRETQQIAPDRTRHMAGQQPDVVQHDVRDPAQGRLVEPGKRTARAAQCAQH